MIDGFQCMIEGMWSIPINLPFTRFHRSLRASTRVHSMVRELIQEKRLALKKGQVSPHQDLITCMISNGGNKGDEGIINQGEIEDNAIIVMIAGHDTSSVLITFFMRLLANDPIVYAKVVHGKVQPLACKWRTKNFHLRCAYPRLVIRFWVQIKLVFLCEFWDRLRVFI